MNIPTSHYRGKVKLMPRGQYDRKKAKEARELGSGIITKSPIEVESVETPKSPIESPKEKPRPKLPSGICICGHTGDGPLSDHGDIPGGEGLGMCADSGCECMSFRFERLTEFFASRGLKTPNSIKQVEDTLKTLAIKAVESGQLVHAKAGEIPGNGKGGVLGTATTAEVGLPGNHREGTALAHPESRVGLPAPEKPGVSESQADRDAETGTRGEPAVGTEVVTPSPSPEHSASPAHNELVSEIKSYTFKPETCTGTIDLSKHPFLTLNPLPLQSQVEADKEAERILESVGDARESALTPHSLTLADGEVYINASKALPIIEELRRRVFEKPLDSAIRLLKEKGYRIKEPSIRLPVYYLTVDKKDKTAEMVVTLTTKEQVKIVLHPATGIGEAPNAPLEPYITISPIEDGISVKDIVRIARGIRKIAREAE